MVLRLAAPIARVDLPSKSPDAQEEMTARFMNQATLWTAVSSMGFEEVEEHLDPFQLPAMSSGLTAAGPGAILPGKSQLQPLQTR